MDFFREMAGKFRSTDGEPFEALWNSALHGAGYLLLQKRLLPKDALVEAFVREAEGDFVSEVAGEVSAERKRAFNCLAEAGDRFSEDWIATVERTEQVPEKDRYAGSSPCFAPDKAILLRHRSGNVRLTLFDAGHAGNYREGAEWLSHQRKGDPAVWNYGNMSAPCPDGTKEITR